MLGYDDLRHTVQVASLVVLEDMVVFWSVDEEHHVGILLDGSRLTEVAQLWSFSFKTFTRLHATVQLTECEDGYVELFRKPFERSGDG